MRPDRQQAAALDVAVVAIGRNEGERLLRCLQSVRGRAALVVYVDSGSSDDSVAAAQALGAEVVALGPLCKTAGVPLVYYSEYSLEVEKQIIETGTRNPLLRWRRKLWATQTERKCLQALPLVAGLQCIGTPTFGVYRAHNPNTMVFFDNRVRREAAIDAASLAAKISSLREARPLRLVFGGRLIRMKGVHHLPEVALHLKRAGISFHLSIYGDGDLRAEVQRSVDQLVVQDHVTLAGVLDFESGWLPVLQPADLLGCCHPQGDPSSTYPKVMSCGVPIVGHDNAALSGSLMKPSLAVQRQRRLCKPSTRSPAFV